MPDYRTSAITAYREHFPQLKSLNDNDIWRVIAINDPELAQGLAKSQEKSVAPVMYPGAGPTGTQTMQDQAAEVLKGIPQAVIGIPAAAKAIGGAVWNGLAGNYGAAADTGSQMLQGAAQPITTSAQGLAALLAPKSVNAPSDESWKQAAQGAGAMLGAAELPNAIAGAGKVISPIARSLVNQIPSKARAGANFQAVLKKAKNVPIDTTEPGRIAMEAQQLSTTGTTLPKVFSDYINKYPADPLAPINYDIGRQFASNAGDLAFGEKQMANKAMLSKVKQFGTALDTSNRAAAVSVGMGDLYDSAMSEFARASNLAEKAAVIKKWAARAAIGAGLYEASKKMGAPLP